MSKKVNEEILAISPRQSLIKRLNVYFGNELGDDSRPFSSQKSVAVREVTDNAVDILRKIGKKGTIRITFFKDKSIEVYDSGSGIPVTMSKTHDGQKASSLYLALGVLNAGSNYAQATDSIGTNGVGGSGAQMLSEYMKVEVYRDKKRYRLDFKEGEIGLFDDKGKFKQTKDLTFLDISKDDRSSEEKKVFPTGTKIIFKLDDSNFNSIYDYEIDYIIDILDGISYLDKNIIFEIKDEINGREFTLNHGGGLDNIVNQSVGKNRLTSNYTLEKSGVFKDKTIDVSDGKAKSKEIEKSINASVTFAYTSKYDYEVTSFVNTLKTRNHGTHVRVFEDCLVNVFNEKLQSMRGYLSKNDKLLPEIVDYREGLRLAVSVAFPEPEFTHQTKESLGGRNTGRILKKLYTEMLEDFINVRKNQNDIKLIADKVIKAFRSRIRRTEELEAEKSIKNLVEKTSKMPSKLVDCSLNYDDDSELYIAEGNSAMTPLKSARSSRNQAILPVRGKGLNVYKASLKKAMENEEIVNLITCLDAGIGEEFDINKARYRKIFIACDADPDGKNISNLLLTTIWKFFPNALLSGRVYKVLPPLYIIRQGKKEYYCLDKQERDEVLKNIKGNYELIRAKGLGETGIEALKVTAMNKETRRVLQVTIDDIKEAEKMLEIVMGEDVSIRKQWLESNPYIEEEELSE